MCWKLFLYTVSGRRYGWFVHEFTSSQLLRETRDSRILHQPTHLRAVRGPISTEMTSTVALTSTRSLDIASDNWRDQSACRDTDPTLFFPVGTTGAALDQIASAKAVCDTCEAKQPCLEFALSTNQDSGVWGGTSEEERRKLRRAWVARQRQAAAAAAAAV